MEKCKTFSSNPRLGRNTVMIINSSITSIQDFVLELIILLSSAYGANFIFKALNKHLLISPCSTLQDRQLPLFYRRSTTDRKVKCCGQGHRVIQWRNWDLFPCPVASGAIWSLKDTLLLSKRYTQVLLPL